MHPPRPKGPVPKSAGGGDPRIHGDQLTIRAAAGAGAGAGYEQAVVGRMCGGGGGGVEGERDCGGGEKIKLLAGMIGGITCSGDFVREKMFESTTAEVALDWGTKTDMKVWRVVGQ